MKIPTNFWTLSFRWLCMHYPIHPHQRKIATIHLITKSHSTREILTNHRSNLTWLAYLQKISPQQVTNNQTVVWLSCPRTSNSAQTTKQSCGHNSPTTAIFLPSVWRLTKARCIVTKFNKHCITWLKLACYLYFHYHNPYGLSYCKTSPWSSSVQKKSFMIAPFSPISSGTSCRRTTAARIDSLIRIDLGTARWSEGQTDTTKSQMYYKRKDLRL